MVTKKPLHLHTMLMPINYQLFSFSSCKVGSCLHQDGQIPPTAAAVISMDTSFRCNCETKSVVKIVRRLRRRVLQIRKAGALALLPPSWSWLEMPSQGPFNMNPGLNAPTQPWTSRYLLQTDVHLKMARCLKSCCYISSVLYERSWFFFPSSVLRLPKPNLLSGHLKFRKCVWMITFYTHCLWPPAA